MRPDAVLVLFVSNATRRDGAKSFHRSKEIIRLSKFIFLSLSFLISFSFASQFVFRSTRFDGSGKNLSSRKWKAQFIGSQNEESIINDAREKGTLISV